MKHYYSVLAAVLALSAAGCVDKDLDVMNKDLKIGTIAVGDANLYIGQTDSFLISKFIPAENAYLRVVDGKYTLYMQDTLRTAMPEVDGVSFSQSADRYANKFPINGVLTIDSIHPVEINVTNLFIPTNVSTSDNRDIVGDNVPTITIPVKIQLPASNKIKSVDTIFFYDNNNNSSTMTVEFDFDSVHSAQWNTPNTQHTNYYSYADSIVMRVVFPKKFKISAIAGSDGRVENDSVFVVNYQVSTWKGTQDGGSGTNSAKTKQFKFRIDHYVIGRAASTLPTTSSPTPINESIKYTMRYHLKRNTASGNNMSNYNGYPNRRIDVKVNATLTPYDAAITTMPNIPLALSKMVYSMNAEINVPQEVVRIDSVVVLPTRNTIQLMADYENFPFRFSNKVGGNYAVSSIDSGKLQLEFPKVARFRSTTDLQPSGTGGRYQYKTNINTLLSATLAVRSFDIGDAFNNDDPDNDQAIFTDSITSLPAVVFLEETHLRRSAINRYKTDTPTVYTSIRTDMEAEKIVGTFSVSQHQDQLHQKFEIGNLLSDMPKIDSIALGLRGSKLNLSISNPTGMSLTNVPLTIKSWKNNTVRNTATKTINVSAAESVSVPRTTNVVLNNTTTGWENIISELLSIDSLTFGIDMSGYTQGIPNQTIYMNVNEQPLDITYKLDVANIVNGFYVGYSDTVAIKLGSKGLKGVKGTLNLELDCYNTMPLELLLDVKALDSMNRVVEGLVVGFEDNKNTIAAGPKTSTLKLSIGQQRDDSDALSKLYALRIRAVLAGKGDGVLSNKDYVQIKIRLVTDGISVDMDKMNE